MSRGNRLFWFAFSTGLPCLLIALISTDHSDARILAVTTCVWLALAYCSFRGWQWARWTAVFILAVFGLSLGVILVAVSAIDLVPGVTASSVDWKDRSWELLFLLSVPTLVLDAGILAFSESVGDFIAWKMGMPVVKDWSQVTATLKRDQRAQCPSRDELLAGFRERKMTMRRARRVTVVAVSLGWMIFLGVVGFLGFALHTDQHRFDTNQQNVFAAAFVVAMILGLTITAIFAILVFTYFTLFVVPFVLALPFVLPFARRWRDPASFLVLRPFNKDQITKDLSRFLRDEFAAFGHCYTLSDRHVRVPIHIRIPVVQGQLSFLNFRLHKIRRARHIEDLVKAMRKRVRRNLNWCFSRTKLFPVTCCDPGWRACVASLAAEVDIVVADLSSLTENIVWELDFLRDAGALVKTVFVVEESQLTEARKRLLQMAEPFQGMPLFAFGPILVSNQGAARERILEILCGKSQAGSPLATV